MTLLTGRIDALKTALANDSALSAWSISAYGRRPIIHAFGFDLRSPPGAEGCPYIVLRPALIHCGSAQTQRERRLQVVCCLHDEESITDPDAAIVEHRGGRRLCELLELALRALDAAASGNELLSLIEAELESIESYPFFMAGALLTISEDYILSADRLAL